MPPGRKRSTRSCRSLGDRYIAYLNEHPDDVQNLVQGQAVGMASEIRDQVRTLTVTGDTVLEALARAVPPHAAASNCRPQSAALLAQRLDAGGRCGVNERNLEGQYAGFLTRAAGFLLDYLVVTALILGTGLLITLILRAFGIDVVTSCRTGGTAAEKVALLLCTGGRVILLVTALLTPPLYYTLLWALVGQTIGQRVMGVTVVRLDGRRIGVKRSFLRWLGYFVCILSAGIGFLWVLIDDRRMGWHDKLAGTTVLYSWKAVQNERFLDRVGRRGRKRAEPAASGEV